MTNASYVRLSKIKKNIYFWYAIVNLCKVKHIQSNILVTYVSKQKRKNLVFSCLLCWVLQQFFSGQQIVIIVSLRNVR